MFSKCICLSVFPDLSNWNLSNLYNLSNEGLLDGMFDECLSLSFMDVSEWKIKNSLLEYISQSYYFFHNCISLLTYKINFSDNKNC